MIRISWLTIAAAWYVWTSFVTASVLIAAAEESPPDAISASQQALPKAEGHWGEDALGFRWVEGDSADARWNQMDTGPFMSSSLVTQTGLVAKSVSVRVGEGKRAASICFDTQRLGMRCAWTGGFLRYTPARFGVIAPPEIDGQVHCALPDEPIWNGRRLEYHGHYLFGSRVIFSYHVDQTAILESHASDEHDSRVVFRRTLRVDASEQELTTLVAPHGTPVRLVMRDDSQNGLVTVIREGDQAVRLKFAPRTRPVQVHVLIGDGALAVNQSADDGSVLELSEGTRGGPSNWGEPIVTRGSRGKDTDALVVDSIEVPFQNRFRALMFLSGHDFFANAGTAAVSTMHGDVWRVTGLDESLETVSWKRIATGLYQPLGLRVINDQIYVLGRDRITRLHDLNQDHEIDFYESYCNDMPTSAGGHDFSTCLETDSQGRFYYVSQAGVHRVSSDGKHWETIATGLRNANGMGISSNDCITVAPQEGEWTPASAVYEVTSGGYYGYGGPQVTPQRPLGFDRPLLFSPRLFDNSTGGQVWVERSDWGPLAGHMLTLSFGQCRVLLNLLEPRRYDLPAHWPVLGTHHVEISDDTPTLARGTTYMQGGSVSLPLHFSSGIMRGRMNTHDGHLYLSGLRGWVSAAAADGCFQRVRYTGRPFYRPTDVRTLANGIALAFSEPLDRATAEDPESYFIEQWNYDYGAHYGSQDFKISQPQEVGRDAVAVRSATLLDDHTIFLQIDAVQPVMQMAITYALDARDGHAMRDVYYHTIHVVPEVRIDEDRLTPQVPSHDRTSDMHLAQGMMWRFESRDAAANGTGPTVDWRADRMVALAVPASEAPTARLPSGPFHARADGFVQLPLRDGITFSVAGRGRVALRINDQLVLAGEGDDLAAIARRTIPLHKGMNRLEVDYESPPDGDAWIRLQWSGSDFGTEALPPTVLFHREDHAELRQATLVRRGAALVNQLRCVQCHAIPSEWSGEHDSHLSTTHETPSGPNLRGIGSRLRREWIAQWLYQPDLLRESVHREMPQMLDSNSSNDRQTALDLAAFLCERPDGSSHLGDSAEESFLDAQASSDDAEDFTRKSDAGHNLFQSLNCNACHHLNSARSPDPSARQSLAAVHWKYSLPQLVRFLKEPAEHYPLSRMPRFALSEEEAESLAAYLMHDHQPATGIDEAFTSPDDQTSDRAEVSAVDAEAADARMTLDQWTTQPGDAVAGRVAFATLGCAACHGDPTLRDTAKPHAAKRLDQLSSFTTACLSVERSSEHRGPHFQLKVDDRVAIQEFLKRQAWQRPTQKCTVESASQAIERLNCGACHERDSQTSKRLTILAEEGDGHIPELLPSLTWTGEKLQVAWMQQLLRGEVSQPTRPWLHARMPQFPAMADLIANGVAHQHGLIADSVEEKLDHTSDQTARATIGQRLIQKSALDCVQCHAVGSLQPQGDERTQIALGINFAETGGRLREEFFHRFVLDPPRYDIRTKMPKLATDGRTTKVTDVFEGDATRQFQAIWQYIQHLDHHSSTVSKGLTP